MASPCDRCGAQVEAGTLFCPQCSAPQIRVTVSGPAAEPATDVPDTPALPEIPPGLPKQTIQWSIAFPLALSLGTAAALLSFAPVLQLFFLGWMFGAGMLCATMYARRSGAALSSGSGARLGAAAGSVAAVAYTTVFVIAIRFTDAGANLRQELENRIAVSSARAEDVAQMKALLHSPEGMAAIVTVGVAMLFVLLVLLALVGGVVGAHASRRRARP